MKRITLCLMLLFVILTAFGCGQKDAAPPTEGVSDNSKAEPPVGKPSPASKARLVRSEGVSDNSKPEPPVGKPSPASKAQLVRSLILKGDQVAHNSEMSAWNIYKLATVYAPKDSGLRRKMSALRVSDISTTDLTADEIVRSYNRLPNLDTSKLLQGWPSPTSETELVELRMLTDPELVGNLHYATFAGAMGSFSVFVSAPKLTLDVISERYGRSLGETTDKDGLRYAA